MIARIRERWKELAVAVAVIWYALTLTSCVTVTKIEAAIWLNNSPIPPEICEREPALRERGFYRRLTGGGFEFVSFCDPKAADWLSMFRDDYTRLMDEANIPKPRGGR